MKYMIGIDIGTQSIRVYLYNQEIELVAKRSVEQYVDTPKPMWITQKASSWWDAVRSSIKDIIAQTAVNPEDILSIGCCAHMHGPVPLMKDRKIACDDIQLYSDKRAADIADKLRSVEGADGIFRLTANPPTSNWFGIKIKWLKVNMPDVYEKTTKFVTPNGYINYMLTEEPCIDPSEASGSYLMDSKSGKWSEVLIKNLGIDQEKLPQIKGSGKVVGNVSKAASIETGLSTRTLVVAGGGDMLCSLFTSGLKQRGSVVDITGTGSIICYYSDFPMYDSRIMNLRHVIDGWVPFGNIDCSGGAFRWLRDNLAKDEAKLAAVQGVDEYEYLSRLAQDVDPGADGLLFFPYLMGERTMGSANSRGCYIGMNLGTKIGHLVRALLEGIAFEHRRTLEVFKDNGASIDRIYHAGGAAKGELWNQIKADIYGIPVYTLQTDEGGVIGAALLGGTAAGLFDKAEDAADLVMKVKKEYLPNRLNKTRYDSLYQVFCETHDIMQKPFGDLVKAVS